VNPQTYLTDLLTRLVNGWPKVCIDELMPWHWNPATPHGVQEGRRAPLRNNYGLTSYAQRAKWGLPASYPMETRRQVKIRRPATLRSGHQWSTVPV